MTKTFRDLDVDPALCAALDADGITHPFPIQELTLPLALEGHDLIGQARTGTGKTLAFGVPLLQRIDPGKNVTQALVVVPTRELAAQVHDDLKIGAALGLRSINVYGGVPYEEQIEALTSGVQVVVGTPGRLLDHLNRGNLDLSNVTELVLDEADEMLDMGFLPDVERLVESCTGENRHTMLFSATMPTAIVKLARRYMDHPTFTRADHEERSTVPEVEQHFFQVHRMDKPRLLARILQTDGRGGVFVFVRTKHMADRLVDELEQLRTPAIAVHGDLRQTTREKNLDRFRRGDASVLVCTEVAARGLDVTGVTHVVNFDCPDDEKMYLHRIGRTARAGEKGVAITFAEFNEVDRLSVIRKAVGAAENEVVQVFSTSPLLAERFALPADRPWDHLATSGGSERRSSGQRPQGRSDGRSKNPRTGEGRGGRHDAARRDERPANGGAGKRKPAANAARGDERPADGGAGKRKPAAETPPRQAPDTPAPPAARTTEQPTAPAAGDDTAGTARTREGHADPAASRTRTRTRARSATSAPGRTPSETRPAAKDTDASRGTGAVDDTATNAGSGDDQASTSPRTTNRRQGRRRARGGRNRGRGGSASSPDEGGGSAASPSQSGTQSETPSGTERGAAAGKTSQSTGSNRATDTRGDARKGDARKGDARKNSAGRSGGAGSRGGRKRGSDRNRSSGNGRGTDRDAEPRRAPGTETPARGRDARGEGSPAPSRRVKVEHLP